jgi:hypothetical protein
VQKSTESSLNEKREILREALLFFSSNLDVEQSDNAETLIRKIGDLDLLEQYAHLLMLKYEIVDIKDTGQLHTALSVVNYIEAADKTYSWERSVLREDLLRLLNEASDE